mmetsp:Transcript_10481/g.17578  ORF Transcript_10481/g.17578 Transcript_10481/m.17578 type:complete len:300 (-) Transcript_10481:427-1326(-)
MRTLDLVLQVLLLAAIGDAADEGLVALLGDQVGHRLDGDAPHLGALVHVGHELLLLLLQLLEALLHRAQLRGALVLGGRAGGLGQAALGRGGGLVQELVEQLLLELLPLGLLDLLDLEDEEALDFLLLGDAVLVLDNNVVGGGEGEAGAAGEGVDLGLEHGELAELLEVLLLLEDGGVALDHLEVGGVAEVQKLQPLVPDQLREELLLLHEVLGLLGGGLLLRHVEDLAQSLVQLGRGVLLHGLDQLHGLRVVVLLVELVVQRQRQVQALQVGLEVSPQLALALLALAPPPPVHEVSVK